MASLLSQDKSEGTGIEIDGAMWTNLSVIGEQVRYVPLRIVVTIDTLKKCSLHLGLLIQLDSENEQRSLSEKMEMEEYSAYVLKNKTNTMQFKEGKGKIWIMLIIQTLVI